MVIGLSYTTSQPEINFYTSQYNLPRTSKAPKRDNRQRYRFDDENAQTEIEVKNEFFPSIYNNAGESALIQHIVFVSTLVTMMLR